MNQCLQQLSMHMLHALYKKHERRDIFISQKAIENQNSHICTYEIKKIHLSEAARW
jgi:hypothetical protein